MTKPHEALQTSASPSWSEASEDGSTGVDFLGTRAVNLEMLTRLTGAYNNVVVSARQHAIVCWAAWRYKENCRIAGSDLSANQFREFMDAVETIQLVGQRELGEQFGGRSGGLGSDAFRRLGDGPVVPLRFKKYGRAHANTSALAAVQYGPSAKPGSFDLLNARSKIWWPTHRGEKLALALDALLAASPSYSALAKFPVPEEMGRGEAIELASHGLFIAPDVPERPERATYIAALFDLDHHPVATEHERRLTLAYLLTLLSQLGESGVGDLQEAMLSCCQPDGTPLELPAFLRKTAARWQLLQVRQLLRYCLESWLFWVEWNMQAASGTAADFVAALVDVLQALDPAKSDLAALLDAPSGDAVSRFLKQRKVHDVLRWAATNDPETPWGCFQVVLDALGDDEPRTAAPGIIGLTLAVLALCDRLVDEKDEFGFATIGDRRRISLLHFKTWWARRATVPLREVLVDFLEELVLQQHVAIAVARFDNEQRRLRFSNDEAGWLPLPGSAPTRPTLTPDRVEALLRLLTDLDLVEDGDNSFSLTDAGEAVLVAVAKAEAKAP